MDIDIYELLAKVSPAEKREIIISLRGLPAIQQLNLPRREDGTIADLSDADLSKLVLSTIDRRANLRGANLENSNLAEAQLNFAQLQNANLVKATLQKTDLRDAHLECARLAEADLRGAYLSGAHFEKANLGFAKLQRADMTNICLEKAELGYANLKKSDLRWGKLRKADLHGADLRGADFLYTNLECANLQDAKLQEVDLSQATLTHIHISGAQLADTRFRREQLGEKIGEEVKGDYKKAADGYRILKQNFEALGDYSAASWAYVKEKQMEKKASAPWRARRFYGQSQLGDKRSNKKDGTIHIEEVSNRSPKALRFYTRHTINWLRSWGVELVCGYGESWERVILSMAIILLIGGPYLLWWSKGLFFTGDAAEKYWGITSEFGKGWHLYIQFLLYMLDAFTTANFSSGQPINDSARLFSGCIAFIGILLTGLLGFVVGNRIRHS